jgi:hypothetical protein
MIKFINAHGFEHKIVKIYCHSEFTVDHFRPYAPNVKEIVQLASPVLDDFHSYIESFINSLNLTNVEKQSTLAKIKEDK